MSHDPGGNNIFSLGLQGRTLHDSIFGAGGLICLFLREAKLAARVGTGDSEKDIGQTGDDWGQGAELLKTPCESENLIWNVCDEFSMEWRHAVSDSAR